MFKSLSTVFWRQSQREWTANVGYNKSVTNRMMVVKTLYYIFLDLRKAYGTDDRERLLEIPEGYGVIVRKIWMNKISNLTCRSKAHYKRRRVHAGAAPSTREGTTNRCWELSWNKFFRNEMYWMIFCCRPLFGRGFFVLFLFFLLYALCLSFSAFVRSRCLCRLSYALIVLKYFVIRFIFCSFLAVENSWSI